MEMADAMYNSIVGFADGLIKYLVVLAAAGALAMALVELWKKLFETRTRFHARAVTRWLSDWEPGTPTFTARHAHAQLIHLCTGVPLATATAKANRLHDTDGGLPRGRSIRTAEHAVFALDLDRMMGHLQEAADIALIAPRQYEALYRFMTAGAPDEDREKWLETAHVPVASVSGPGGTQLDPADVKARADRYGRLQQSAKRKLDALQLFTGTSWANWQQFSSNAVGVGILVIALIAVVRNMPADAQVDRGDWIYGLALCAFGGILAPIAKDVIVMLQNVRQRV